MKYFSIIFLLIIVHNVNSQNHTDSLGKRQGTWVVNLSYDSITELNNVFVQCEFKDDVLHGVYRVFDENENLRYETFLFNGIKNGLGYIYDTNFKVRRIYTYSNDNIISLIYLDENNKLIETKSLKDEKLSGFSSIFFENGRLMRRSLFIDGKRNGKETIFNKKGGVESIFEYSDDIFKGKIKD